MIKSEQLKTSWLNILCGPRISYAPMLYTWPELTDLPKSDNKQRAQALSNKLIGTTDSPQMMGSGESTLYNSLLHLIHAVDNQINCVWPFPETHLHPAAQVKLPNLLLKLIYDWPVAKLMTLPEHGVVLDELFTSKILVPTHSEHFILRVQKLIRTRKLKHTQVSVHYLQTWKQKTSSNKC